MAWGTELAAQKRTTRQSAGGSTPWWKVPPVPSSPTRPRAPATADEHPPQLPLPPLLPASPQQVALGPAEAAKARAAAAQAALFPDLARPLPRDRSPPARPQAPGSGQARQALQSAAAPAGGGAVAKQRSSLHGGDPSRSGAAAAEASGLPHSGMRTCEAKQPVPRSRLQRELASLLPQHSGPAHAGAASAAVKVEDGPADGGAAAGAAAKPPATKRGTSRELAALLQQQGGAPHWSSPPAGAAAKPDRCKADLGSEGFGGTSVGWRLRQDAAAQGPSQEAAGAAKGGGSPAGAALAGRPKAEGVKPRFSRELAALQHDCSAAEDPSRTK